MWIFSLLAIAVVVGLAVSAWQRGGRRWRTGWVEGLRVLLVAAAVLLLWQPESVYQVESDQTSAVVVLVDQSNSMQTLDAKFETAYQTRAAAADRVSNDLAWQQLGDRFQRVVEPFAVENAMQTDLAGAIDRVAEQFQSVASIVLVSDGDWNQGGSPIGAAATVSTSAAVPAGVSTIGIGSEQRLPDVELVSADVPTFGVVAKPVRIPFTVRNWYSQPNELTVSLQVSDANASLSTVEQQTIQVAAGGRYDGTFTWQSDVAGPFQLTIDVPVVQTGGIAEANAENNRLTKQIEIRNEQLRVLIVESVPRWEYRYLRNALLRDPGIEVSCLLFQPDLEKVGGGGPDYLSALPSDAAELASYDVIFLGDVGVGAKQLTLEQCQQIRGLVRQQAAGLVLMPGRSGNQNSLLDTELADLFPVEMDRNQPAGIGGPTPGTLTLSAMGRRSLLTELTETADTNWSVWKSLPGFYWHAAVTRAKAGSDVLAVHGQTSNSYGRLPLLVTGTAGAGKVLFMGTDSAWRWRLGVEDKYHYRFWGQVIRWMAYQRNMAVGQTMRLSYRPEQPQPNETISFRASVMTSGGEPATADVVAVETVSPSGQRQTLWLDKQDAQWGVYAGQTQLAESGEYTLTLVHPSEQSTIDARLVVQGRGREQVGGPARLDVMREIARVGHGQIYGATEIASLVQRLNQLPPPDSDLRRIQWWNHPAVLLAMLGGLALFWMGRKWAGAI
ncbi:hypothetical protein NHH03_00270 [Stieleria sp. TO1_6]|nr:hypothetical protein [Stieleria tagensis]